MLFTASFIDDVMFSIIGPTSVYAAMPLQRHVHTRPYAASYW